MLNHVQKIHLSKTGWIIIVVGVLLVLANIDGETSVLTKITSAVVIIGVSVGAAFAVTKVSDIKKGKKTGRQMIADMRTNLVADKEIASEITTSYFSDKDYSGIVTRFNALETEKKDATLFYALEKIVDKYQEKGSVSSSDEDDFLALTDYFNYNRQEMYGRHFYQEFVKLLIINDLLEGVFPSRVSVPPESITINLQKDEHVLWAFENANLYELTKKSVFVGESVGWSGKIMKGLYYRKSSFRGETIVTQNMAHVASGNFYMTDKNLYFSSTSRGLRIPYNKVVSYIPYEDGIGIMRDGASSKPLCVKGIDGWFAYNFVKNVGNIV